MGKWLVLPALLSSGCAMAFMDHVPDHYNPQEMEPQCTESSGFVLWDLGISAVDVAGIVMVAKSEGMGQDQTRALAVAFAVAFAAEGLLHAASAMVGSGWAQSCRKAHDQHAEYTRSLARQSKQKDARLQALLQQVAAQQAAQQRQTTASTETVPSVAASSEPEPPVGFYCTSKVCTRELGMCERFRAATRDAAPCRHVESAFCFAIDSMRSCRADLEACRQQRGAAARADSECFEAH